MHVKNELIRNPCVVLPPKCASVSNGDSLPVQNGPYQDFNVLKDYIFYCLVNNPDYF